MVTSNSLCGSQKITNYQGLPRNLVVAVQRHHRQSSGFRALREGDNRPSPPIKFMATPLCSAWQKVPPAYSKDRTAAAMMGSSTESACNTYLGAVQI
ncbi:hypothetical protein PoB_004524900 [Plakobranchus ocellatus]|uniref:Uncharacterized protein n=1 Tax=Plakobranchus ocellatus TaxID=259542 RepID=A0AAV4BIN4_9GAST|nr:hypothetical protein PoB_004524900 [Plakobranchus ocellatus]